MAPKIMARANKLIGPTQVAFTHSFANRYICKLNFQPRSTMLTQWSDYQQGGRTQVHANPGFATRRKDKCTQFKGLQFKNRSQQTQADQTFKYNGNFFAFVNDFFS